MSFFPVYDPHLSSLEWFGPQASPASFFDVTYAETGSTVNSGAGEADGTSTATAVGAALVLSVGTANGLSTATAVGAALVLSVGTANGLSTATGAAGSIAAAVAAADGKSSVLASGAAVFAATGAADGTSTAAAAAIALSAAAGNINGNSTASAVGAAATVVAILGAGPDETWSPWLGKAGYRGVLQKILPSLEVPKAAKAPENQTPKPEPDYFDQIAARVIAQYKPGKSNSGDLEAAISRAERAIAAKRQADELAQKARIKEYTDRVRRDGERRQRALKDELLRQQGIAQKQQEILHAESAIRAREIKRRIERDNEEIIFLLGELM
jgi:hypothetical protein